ncbi:MAG: Ig-like domain-containing protein [Metallibacterium sp.]
MNEFKSSRYLQMFMALMLSALLAGCSGGGSQGRAPILGAGGTAALAPTVTAVTPANNATGVATSNPVIAASFSEPMAPITGAASFTVTCAASCTSPTGTVALDTSNTVATFTLTPGTTLQPLTLYTATITGATSLATGLPLASPYVWTFTTGIAPTVTAVAPVNNATGVTTNNTIITAAFSEPMAPITGAASFTVTCAASCTSPTGTVTLNASNTIATYTLTSGTTLQPSTLYTATVTAAQSISGLAMVSPYVWTFTTGVAPDTTRPRVASTVPTTTTPGPTTGVPTNTAITAVFTEEMAPATITGTSFTLTGPGTTAVAGTVSYTVGTATATFTPTAALAAGTTYTATITSAATDVAGNALAGNQASLPAASNYVWTFTTATAVASSDVSVLSTIPVAGASAVCPNATINATFNVPSGLRMDPTTVNSATFTVTGPAPASTPVTAGSVVLDGATGTIATFTPLNALTAGVTYTATIKGGANGVKDLAIPANGMASDFVWTFTVGSATGNCLAPVALGSATTFGDFGGSAGMTNQGTLTVVNGDIGTTAVSTAVTGFHDAGPQCIYTQTPLNIGTVNGTIYTAPPPPTVGCPTEGTSATLAIATQAHADALTAYNALVALPGGPDPGAGNLANLVLTPGVYTAAAGSFMIQGGNLTLNAQGNANAVWVFQMATSLTVGGPGAAFPQSIILENGAQAKNVFWQVGSAATINAGGGGTMVGTIISQSGVTISTAGNSAITTLNGRAISLGASVTIVNTVINVPAP